MLLMVCRLATAATRGIDGDGNTLSVYPPSWKEPEGKWQNQSSYIGEEVRLLWWCTGLWFIPECLSDSLADTIRAVGDDGTLVLYPNGKPVDMIMAEMTDHEDAGRGIPHHLAVQAPGDPVDLEERECEVFGTEFAVSLNGNFARSFLHRGQPGKLGHLHDRL
jgi:hypothetical protein